MALKDYMPWGRRGRDAGALENVRGVVASLSRALEEPWELTSARLLGSEWTPRLEVSETSKEVVVSVNLPGVDKEDVHLSATADTLSIRGVKKNEDASKDAAKDEDQTPAGGKETFYRSIALPATVRPDDVTAHLKDGRLTVTLPKAKHSQVRRITIH